MLTVKLLFSHIRFRTSVKPYPLTEVIAAGYFPIVIQ